MKKLGPLTEREEQILRSMASSIVNKLVQTPIIQLRKYAQTDQGHLYAQILRNLFDLPIQIDDKSTYLADSNRGQTYSAKRKLRIEIGKAS